MAIELNTGKLASTNINAGTDQQSAGTVSRGGTQPILGGDSVQVSNAPSSDLEKLVAQIKNENEQQKSNTAQRRIAILLTVLNAMSNRVTEQQRNGLVQLDKLSGDLADLQETLEKLEKEAASSESASSDLSDKIEQLQETIRKLADQEKELREQLDALKQQQASATPAEAAAMDVQIQALEAAIERAVQDGAEHRKRVQELKAQRADDDEKARQAHESATSVFDRIAAVKSEIAACEKAIGAATLAEVTNAIRAAAGEVKVASEQTESTAEEAKAQKKALANDPFIAIRQALDKMDEDIMRTIEENRLIKA